MDISSRIAVDADRERLVSLWRDFMEEQGSSDYKDVELNWVERLTKQIASEKVIVACCDSGIIGFVGFIDHSDRQWVSADVAYVVDIYVTPQARASHAARSLFTAVRRVLKIRYLKTWTNTALSNKRMQILLDRAGFSELSSFEIDGLEDQLYYQTKN